MGPLRSPWGGVGRCRTRHALSLPRSYTLSKPFLPSRLGDRHSTPGRPCPPPQARRPPPHPRATVSSSTGKETATPPEGDRKGPIPSSTLPPPLQRLRGIDELHRIFVRAGVEWSRVGTLAVALGWGLALLPHRQIYIDPQHIQRQLRL